MDLKLCLGWLTPEANKNNEENILYFMNTLLNIAEEHIPKSSTSTKYNRPWFNKECKKAVRLRRVTFKNFKINPTWGNLNTYKNSQAKVWKIIKDSKRNTWRNCITKINGHTKPKQVWQMIWKITGENNNTPTKHLTHNNLKITDEKDIVNHLAKNFSQNWSTKNQSKSFQIIKTKADKVKIKFQSKNNKAHNTAVGPDKIHYQFLKDLPEPSTNLLWFIGRRWHTKNMERNHSYTDTKTFQRQYKCKKL